MIEILNRYCFIVSDFGDCVLYAPRNKQGFEFLYVNDKYVEFRVGLYPKGSHIYKDKEKLQMLFDSWE